MKIMKLFLKCLVFLLGVLAAMWFFMPWAQIGEYALLRVPAQIGYASVENAPSGGFLVRDLDVRNLMGMANFSCRTLTVGPDLFVSAMSLAPACRIAFTGGVLGDTAVTPLRKIPGVAFGDGGVLLSLGRREILLDNLRSNGDLSMSGVMALAPRAARLIAWAEVDMRIRSEAFDRELPFLQQALGLPLQRQKDPGHWILQRPRPGVQKEEAAQ